MFSENSFSQKEKNKLNKKLTRNNLHNNFARSSKLIFCESYTHLLSDAWRIQFW